MSFGEKFKDFGDDFEIDIFCLDILILASYRETISYGKTSLFRLVDEDRHFSPDLSPIHIVIITNLHDYDHCGVCKI